MIIENIHNFHLLFMKNNLALITFFTVCCFDCISSETKWVPLNGMPRRIPDYPTAKKKKRSFFQRCMEFSL